MIEKIAKKQRAFLREYSFYNSAREGWATVIEHFSKDVPNVHILLPAFIGWSSNEGSGIFDPVKESKLPFSFYKINRDFSVDVEDLKSQCTSNTLVLIVHYFGFIDKSYIQTTQWLRANNIKFVEDCAHALLSDLIGGVCGRNGQFSFYSLHKLLPITNGGMLSANGALCIDKSELDYNVLWQYDLKNIFEKRRANFNYLTKALLRIPNVTLLYSELPDGIGPQTLPVLLKDKRDHVYHKMNKSGFGMVSLYHTMIDEISEFDFADSHFLAKHIINFPIHQDISFTEIDKMVDMFNQIYNQ